MILGFLSLAIAIRVDNGHRGAMSIDDLLNMITSDDDDDDDLIMFGQKKCDGPHTKIEEGRCVCEKGFVSMGPIDERGCWKCQDKCHSLGGCNYPGECNCLNGHYGDGVKSCRPPIPFINRTVVHPASIMKPTEVEVFYRTAALFDPYNAFCSINGRTTVGALTNQSSVLCWLTKKGKRTWKIAISFDGQKWSSTSKVIADVNEAFVKVEQPKKRHLKKSLGLGALVMTHLIYCLSLFVRVPKRKGRNDSIPLLERNT